MISLCAKKPKGEITKPNWLELPIDLMKNILERLDTVEIVTSARNVCPRWWNICKDPLMWRTIHIDCIHFINPFDYSCLEKICRCAIDLSCGHLKDINIEVIGTDDLLKYLVHRASHLQRLRLVVCDNISDKGLSEFVKFSLLEKIEILYYKNISKDTIEVIGQCCPLLNSLILKRMFDYPWVKCYDEAFAIAKTMSGLRHLKLSRILINNAGFLAILDGCHLLESLDLEWCRCRYLSRSLEKRCNQQIKDFRPPNYLYDKLFDDDDDDEEE